MEKQFLLEICCCSVDDAIQAAEGGADRIELNCALESGGLTPPIGMLIEVKKRINSRLSQWFGQEQEDFVIQRQSFPR